MQRPCARPEHSISGWPTRRCPRGSARAIRRRRARAIRRRARASRRRGARASRRRGARAIRPSRASCQTRIPMSAEQRTYESAVERLEAIIRRLDSNEAGLRETLELVKEGRALIEYAAAELDAVGKGLEELKLDDLIARLEAAGPADASRN